MNKLDLVRKTFWNAETYREVRRSIQAGVSDVVHCRKLGFPFISPSLYRAVLRTRACRWCQHAFIISTDLPGSTLIAGMDELRRLPWLNGLALSGIRHPMLSAVVLPRLRFRVDARLSSIGAALGMTWSDSIHRCVRSQFQEHIHGKSDVPVDRHERQNPISVPSGIPGICWPHS